MKKNVFMILFALLIGCIMFASINNIIDSVLGMCVSMTLASIFSIIVAITAYKNDIKLIVVIMVLAMIVEIGILSFNVVSIFVKDKDETFYLIIEQDNSNKKKMFSFENTDFYSYNVKDVSVHSKERVYSLENAFKNDILKIEDILSNSISNTDTSDYEIHYNGGIDSIKNDEFSIIVCKSGDIVFGPYTYNYNESICRVSVSD